jgi:hypothetical protein
LSSARLHDHNRGLERLLAEGYEAEVRHQHLLVHSVPYVTASRVVRRGTLLCTYIESGGLLQPPDNHQVWFAGEHPCFADGRPMAQIAYESGRRELAPGVWIDHRFSNKPDGLSNFANHFDKMVHYVTVLQDQARVLESDATAQTSRPVVSTQEDSVFRYADTASARSETLAVSMRLAMNKIAIVGLGGTGSYVLDQLAKTPVREIHLFDGDEFRQHNAFRAPAAATLEEIGQCMFKVEYFRRLYDAMRRGLIAHAYYLEATNIAELTGFDFVFLCVDRGPDRALIARFLISQGIPFVDVGMSVDQDPASQQLDGLCRATFCTPAQHDHFHRYAPTDEDAKDVLYRRNIQIADLNAMNALLGVIKWKQYCGFYADDFGAQHLTFGVRLMSLGRGVLRDSTGDTGE